MAAASRKRIPETRAAREEKSPPVTMRDPTRYSVRVQSSGGKIDEISIGTDPAEKIEHAKRHHSQHGMKTWVWNVRTGATIFRIDLGVKRKWESVRKVGAN